MYTVPIIPPDLRHEETIIQAASALDCLQKTINSIFEKIDARIASNNAKIQEIGERVGKAQTKIKGLAGTKKAIKIYAPARFPSTAIFHDIAVTREAFTNVDSMEVTASENLAQQHEVQSRVDVTTTAPLQEKMVFFHVRTAQVDAMQDKLTAVKAEANKRIGLGVVPEQLRSVNSLLRFNTEEYVYGADSLNNDLNSWKRAKLFKNQRAAMRHTQNLTQKQLLDPAPHSLAHRNQKLTPAGEWRYTPKLNEAPEIDLPMDLPDLPGIADDIHFEGKEQQYIAPSLFIDNLPDLPELEKEQTTEMQLPQTVATTNIPIIATSANATTMPLPPPPPPPPAPALVNKPPVAAATPPPPPPPPPLAPKEAQTPASRVTAGDSRSELMDAIRKAGGAAGGRLRSAAAAPVDVVDTKTKFASANKSSAGGDLMADLHNKLLMRRKGISGAKQNATTGAADPLISRLSALIPPPAAKASYSHTNEADDDDDDDDEENENDSEWID